ATDDGYEVEQTVDGGYVVTGSTYSTNGDVTNHHGTVANADYWVVKLDAAGTLMWEKTFGGSRDDIPRAIQQTAEGGYIVAGYTNSQDGDVSGYHGSALSTAYDYWILKLSATGSIQWQKCYGGTLNDQAFAVKQTADGGYIINGSSQSLDGDMNAADHLGINDDFWVLKLGAAGQIEWQRSLGGNGTDRGSAVQLTADGGYILGGGTTSVDGEVTGLHKAPQFFGFDYWLVKLDKTGALEWQKCIGGTSTDEAWCVQQTGEGGYIIAGRALSQDGDVTPNSSGQKGLAWIVKTDSKGNIEWNTRTGGNWAFSVQPTLDQGIVITGITDGKATDVINFHGGTTDMWVAKFKGGICQPTIAITSLSNNVCQGAPVQFSAVVTNEGNAPSYQWKINGNNTGTNSNVLYLPAISSGDTVTCLLNSTAICAVPATVLSNAVVLKVQNPVTPIVSVNASSTTICKGSEIVFTASVQNGVGSPMYQWKVNGVNTGSNSVRFSSRSLDDLDHVYCIYSTGSPACIPGMISSDTVVVKVNPLPVIKITPSDTVVNSGSQIRLAAIVNGGVSTFVWSPANALTGTSSLSPLTNPIFDDIIYRIVLTNLSGCSSTASAHASVNKGLFMPNVFSPDGNGLNDVYRIPKNTSLSLIEFSVFNRWGQKIFTTRNKDEGWDGKYKDQLQEQGTYSYLVTGVTDKGPIKIKGSLLLVR
ncbi:MAG: gliding motility-associated C-terminal domain-containing protein, partial [Chitinophagaceae bacterium]